MLANFIICKRDHEYLDPCAAHTTTNNTTRNTSNRGESSSLNLRRNGEWIINAKLIREIADEDRKGKWFSKELAPAWITNQVILPQTSSNHDFWARI